MKKYFIYLVLFIIINSILLINVNAKVNTFWESEGDAESEKCTTTEACASDVNYSGLRITLIDSEGKTLTRSVNFWSDSTAVEFVTGKTDRISVSPNNKYGCAVDNKSTNIKGDSIAAPNIVTNIGLQALVKNGNVGYKLPAAWANYIEKTSDPSIIAKTIIAVLTENTSDSANDINLSNYKNTFFKVEPIFIIKENYFKICNFYSGTTHEVMELWGNDNNDSFGRYYVNGGCNSMIGGAWNVLRNYATVLYYPCSEQTDGGPQNVECYRSSNPNLGNLSNYMAKMSCESNNLDYFNKEIFKGTGANGLGVGYFNVSKFIKNGTLSIKKINSVTGVPISSVKTTFEVYSGENCTGKIYKTVNTNAGVADISLPAGIYSVYESGVPSKYNAPSNRCVIKSVTIASGNKTSKVVENEPTCEQELNDLGPTRTPDQLINLYVKYKTQKNLDYRRLLDFSNNGVNAKCSTKTNCGELETGCLTATKGTVGTDTFSFENFVCYDGEIISTLDAKAYGFCKDQLSVNNIFEGITKFYAKNGQFLIQELTEEGKIQYYSLIDAAKKQLKLEEIDKNHIASAIVTKQCYFLKSYGLKEQAPLSLELYFGDNNADGSLEKLKKYEIQEEPLITNHTYFTGVKYVNKISFSFNPTHIKKITGRVSEDAAEDTVTKYGIVSKFNPDISSGTIPFKVKFGSEQKENNSCVFETFEQIPEFNLEFRIIDTQNPFVGQRGNFRDTNTNWCDNDNCSFDNDLVNRIIKNSTNSYGMKNGTKQEPIYEITLTPSDIKLIREYNKENKYDNYEMYCKGENDCVNAFINDLKQGTVKKYDTVNFISKTKKVYGTLKNKLITN